MLLEIDSNGAVVFGGRIVGEFDNDTDNLVLNAGWCRLAGLSFRIDGDSTDRRKVLVERNLATPEPEPDKPIRGTHPARQAPEDDARASGGQTSNGGSDPIEDPWAKGPEDAEEKSDTAQQMQDF